MVLGGLFNPNGINAAVVYVQHPISPVVTDFSPKSWKALEDVYASFGRARNLLNGYVEFDIDTSIIKRDDWIREPEMGAWQIDLKNVSIEALKYGLSLQGTNAQFFFKARFFR